VLVGTSGPAKTTFARALRCLLRRELLRADNREAIELAWHALRSRRRLPRVRKLVLFDIDGTLLRAYGAGGRAMRRAAEEILGERCRGAQVEFGGALDPWIFGQLALHGGYEVTPVVHAAFRAHYRNVLAEELAHPAARCLALPGVHDVLARMRAERPATLGLLTGNYAETAALKLRAAGIDPTWFEVNAWGDLANERHALVPVALAQLSHALEARDVVIVGDTPRDVHCARVNGCACVAVATGGNSARELADAGADVVLEDLRDAAALWRLLG
jgi:phosphoglycolate phosphatase-like HAD superfamily hydrolase